MASHNLHKLAEKYWEGASTEQEERLLREQLGRGNPPEGLEALADYLRMLDEAQKPAFLNEEFDAALLSEIGKKSRMRSIRTWSLRIAAAIVIALGLALAINSLSDSPANAVDTEFADTFDDPEEAYREVRKALMMVSTQMNDGMEHTQMLGEFHKTKTELEPKQQIQQ